MWKDDSEVADKHLVSEMCHTGGGVDHLVVQTGDSPHGGVNLVGPC